MKKTSTLFYLAGAALIGIEGVNLLLGLLEPGSEILWKIQNILPCLTSIIAIIIIPIFFMMVMIDNKEYDKCTIATFAITALYAVLAVFMNLISLLDFMTWNGIMNIQIPSIFYDAYFLINNVMFLGFAVHIIAIGLSYRTFVKKYNMLVPVLASCILLILSCPWVSRYYINEYTYMLPGILYVSAFAVLSISYGIQRIKVNN
jgi:hypothetical protein